MTQTIATLQTPPGRGGIAVIDLAGPGSGEIIEAVFRPMKSHRAVEEGQLQLGHLVDEGRLIDEAVVCHRAGRVEINIHGGPQTARAAMGLLQAHGAVLRPAPAAGPDSFALAHERWNNPAIGAELLACLPSASSVLAASALTRQWSGGISRLARTFLDSSDNPAGVEETARRLAAAGDGIVIMERLLNPPEVVLVGPPNAGKSTLANALTGRQVSIVHERPGTTRDWVRELALLDGAAVWVTDTAGLWDSDCLIDAEAIRRAHDRARQADLVVLLEAGRPAEMPQWLRGDNVLTVAAKCDQYPPAGDAEVNISSVTGMGMDRLRQAIRDALGLGIIKASEPMAFTRRQSGLLSGSSVVLDKGDLAGARQLLRRLLEESL